MRKDTHMPDNSPETNSDIAISPEIQTNQQVNIPLPSKKLAKVHFFSVIICTNIVIIMLVIMYI
jgi:hypothetical protein